MTLEFKTSIKRQYCRQNSLFCMLKPSIMSETGQLTNFRIQIQNRKQSAWFPHNIRCITKTRPCNIQQFLTAVKMIFFQMKISSYFSVLIWIVCTR